LDISNLWIDVRIRWNGIGEEMMKTPEEMAEYYISTIADTHSVKAACEKAFIAGYKAAQAIVEEELQAVQAQRVERPGLGSAEYALKSALAKMGGK
jgi:hypothetical protein